MKRTTNSHIMESQDRKAWIVSIDGYAIRVQKNGNRTAAMALQLAELAVRRGDQPDSTKPWIEVN